MHRCIGPHYSRAENMPYALMAQANAEDGNHTSKTLNYKVGHARIQRGARPRRNDDVRGRQFPFPGALSEKGAHVLGTQVGFPLIGLGDVGLDDAQADVGMAFGCRSF